MTELTWTGERYLPWIEGAEIHYEHLHRYHFASQFAIGKRVLDFASGEGYGSFILSKVAKHVIGIDIDPLAVRHANSKYGTDRVEFLLGSISALPLTNDKRFDLITCFEVIEHIHEQDQLINEVRRVLAPNGVFLISTPNKEYSDHAYFHDNFHVKELYLHEFLQLLKNSFDHVALLGQGVFPVSSIYPLDRDEYTTRDYYITHSSDQYLQVDLDQKKPRYYLAMASYGPTPSFSIPNGSTLVDVSESAIIQRDQQIMGLQRIIKEKDKRINELDSKVMSQQEKIKNIERFNTRLIPIVQQTIAVLKTGVQVNIILSAGELCLRTRDHQGAIYFFQKAFISNPENVAPLLHLGQLYLEDEEYELAKRFFEKALSLDSTCEEARIGIQTSLQLSHNQRQNAIRTPRLSWQANDEQIFEPIQRSHVSVIIPTLNGAKDLRILIPTLLMQKGLEGLEIIAVDSGSQDETLEVLQEYQVNVQHIHPEEFTHSSARNFGAKVASGDVLLFITQDALPASFSWASQVLYSMRQAEAIAASCIEMPREDADLFDRMHHWQHYKFLGIDNHDRILACPANETYENLRRNAQLTNVACMIERSIFNDHEFRGKYGEDLDLGLRLIREGFRLALLRNYPVIHSHARAPYYHLKRGFIDTVFLSQTFSNTPGFVLPKIILHDICNEVIVAVHAIYETGQAFTENSQAPIQFNSAKKIIDQYLKGNAQSTHPAKLTSLSIDIGDPLVEQVIRSCFDLNTRNGKNGFSPHSIGMIESIHHESHELIRYLENIYPELDASLLQDCVTTLNQILANHLGIYLGYCYLNGSPSEKAFIEQLTASGAI